jgi:MinD-like ATPase involved in chromosome partitioning or flagellar assembly
MDCQGNTMTFKNSDIAPLTWLDVERRFKENTANYTNFEAGISSIQCFSDGAEIEYGEDDVQGVKQWLRAVFGISLAPGDENVILNIGATSYPIKFFAIPGQKTNLSRTYPLWRDQAYIGNSSADFPPVWKSGPNIIAFHSFKGGVGRTTSLMTYAAARINAANDKPVRILLIDADLEAPGISFWLANENRPTVSFIKLLEALHYPPVDTDTSLNYFAAELRKTSLNVGGANREIFILPAALNVNEIMDMPVQPEHIARNPSNPWLLTDQLNELGKKLEVDMIFVDLRAGLSELASPLLFDPRIEHFFVTTVAPQSIAGMAEILTQLHNFQSELPEARKSLAKPSVIVSLLTNQLKQLPVFTQASERLNRAYPAPSDDLLSTGFEWLEAEFNESLMSIGTVKEALELLPKSSLYKTAELWARNLILESVEPEKIQDVSLDDRQKSATALYETCQRFQFAEVATTDDMLVTDPLRNLAKHYTDELPNIVSVGAKGAGKTFTYIQICRTQSWFEFLRKLDHKSNRFSTGAIYPLLASSNLGDDSLKIVEGTRTACETKIGFISPKGSNSFSSRIKTALRIPDTDWDILLEQLIIDEFSAGCKTLEEFNIWLALKDESIVLVIDGIEDLFDELEENENHKRAIKALLQLPNRLNELRNRRIGLVCFVRADYVQAVIRQNLAQYLSRFQSFKLEWTPESFLRLAYWICGKAEIISANPELAATLTTEQLLVHLERLWGKKLGGDGSKEANTARWVFAALCDLNGRLQARDLVRFLKFSARQMMKLRVESWPDRLLFPEAIRKSLPECSEEKINEAASEIKVLKQWQKLLQELKPEERRVPFNASAVGLTPEILTALKELGIIYEDIDRLDEANRFYLPEIYRSGLGFQSASVGRPRVQALLKRNLGGIPF